MQCTTTWKQWLPLIFTISQAGALSAPSSTTNVARNKPAAQSSTSNALHDLKAANAVDGDYSTNVHKCQHTAGRHENDNNPTRWWLVDLQAFYDISSVQITNRGDCCADRLRDFDIQVFLLNPITTVTARAHACYHYQGPMGAGVTELLVCSQPIRGRYVRIIMPTTNNPMHVCEVEVLAKDSVSTNSRYVRVKGQKAAGKMLREVTSRNVMHCLTSCSQDLQCSAVNMGLSTWTSAGRSRLCQLLSFGGIGQPTTTTEHLDWDFYNLADF